AVTLDGFGIPGITKFVMHSDPGDYIGGGLDYYYKPANATFGFYGGSTHVGGGIDGDNGDWWNADFEAPQGDILAVGTYKHATRYPFNGSGPGLSIDGNGRGCNTLTGRFTVTSIFIAP